MTNKLPTKFKAIVRYSDGGATPTSYRIDVDHDTEIELMKWFAYEGRYGLTTNSQNPFTEDTFVFDDVDGRGWGLVRSRIIMIVTAPLDDGEDGSGTEG